MKKKRLALIVALAVSLVAGVVSLAACGGNDGDEAFSAPKNAKVSGTLFTWDAVEKADNGYTVKINSGEVQVTVTELDLTSNAATAYIKEGANSLSVKVNATDALKESTYSNAVTYTYTISEDTLSEAAKAFKTAVEAIATLDASSDKTAIDGADAAITNALATYENLSSSDKTDVVAVKNSLDGKKEALNTAIAAQISAYKTAVEAAEEAANASVEELEAAIAAANAKKDALAEATKTAKAEEYAAYNTRLETVTAALDTMKGPAAAVKALKDEVDALSNETTVSVEYYNQLTALKEKIEALSDEAKALWDEADTAKVEAEITRVEETPTDCKKSDEAFGFGGNGTLYILRDYVNVLGGQITFETAPAIAYQIINNETDGAGQQGTLTRNENGVYSFTIPYNPTLANNFVYTVEGEDEVTLKFAPFTANLWLNGSDETEGEFRKLFNNEDKLIIHGDGYADVYLADDVNIGTSDGAQISISGNAIAKGIPVKEATLREDFYRAIARSEYGKAFIDNTLEVRFVFYNQSIDEETDVITRTTVPNASVSEKITISLTDYDYKYEIAQKNIFDLGVWPDGSFSLINAGYMSDFLSQFEELYPDLTADNVTDYFQILISAYEGENSEASFTKAAPLEAKAYDYLSFMKAWAVQHFKNGGADNTEVHFSLTYTIQLKETVNGKPNPLAKDFRDSASAKVNEPNDYSANGYGTYTFTKADVTIPTDIQIGRTNEPIFLQNFAISNDMINGYVSHVEVYMKNGENAEGYHTAYILYNAATETFTLHKNVNGSDSGLPLIKGGNEYYVSWNDFNTWVRNNYSEPAFDIDGEGWYFQTKIVDNENDDQYLFGEGESEWVTFYKAPAPDTGDGE
ncbi:MAG: hypothetical protein K2G44_01310 [Clostridia bacterium]|nr:hypothetical protein [Clostridia bacterium]